MPHLLSKYSLTEEANSSLVAIGPFGVSAQKKETRMHTLCSALRSDIFGWGAAFCATDDD